VWNHTVLIGWTENSTEFIRQIALANESAGGGVIAVLADEGKKQDAEHEFRRATKGADLMGTQIIFRGGSPQMISSLELVGEGILAVGNHAHDHPACLDLLFF